MTRIRRAHYGALVGVALLVTALLVTVGGGWRDVQSAAGVVMAVLSALLVLKALSVVAIIGLRSIL